MALHSLDNVTNEIVFHKKAKIKSNKYNHFIILFVFFIGNVHDQRAAIPANFT